MARIAGVNIPTNKRVVIALQYIHGIGPAKAREIVAKVNIPENRRVNELSDAEAKSIVQQIENASGRTVEATRSVDPSLIGGIVLRIGSHLADGSVRGRLERLRHELATAH